MNKNHFTKFTLLILILVFTCCCKDDDNALNEVTIGQVTVDLDANKSLIRTEEAIIGNMIADAMSEFTVAKGKLVDFSIINAGSIRFDDVNRPSGIYPAGNYNSSIVEEMIPFGDALTIVKIKGYELKEIFERSVAQLPQAKGPFLQVSKEIIIEIDLSKPPQMIDQTVSPAVIVSSGERISSIKINNVEYDSLAEYSIVVNDFIADGNDGYVTFFNIPSDKKEFLDDLLTEVLIEYIIVNSPVTPVLGDRIIFQ